MQQRKRVLIQSNLLKRGEKWFQKSGLRFFPFQQGREEELLRMHLTHGINCFVIGAEPIANEVFAKVRPQSVFVRYGVGYDNIPIELCRERSILVTNTPNVLNDSVAEHTVALMLAAARQIATLDRALRSEHWLESRGLELKGKTIALIGFGGIAKKVAFIVKNGFGMHVKAWTRNADIALEENDNLVDVLSSDFSQVVRGADFVSIHLPLAEGTVGFINEGRLKLIPNWAILINTARGPIVDEVDLYRALTQGGLAGAALDVFANEPYRPLDAKSDLRRLDNVVLTPHVASSTDTANKSMSEACIANINAYYDGSFERMTIIPELLTGKNL